MHSPRQYPTLFRTKDIVVNRISTHLKNLHDFLRDVLGEFLRWDRLDGHPPQLLISVYQDLITGQGSELVHLEPRYDLVSLPNLNFERPKTFLKLCWSHQRSGAS